MGSDTCGSIRIPSAHNNLVGLRGTQGLSSRRGIIPLSHTQDIGGPLARSVTDLAIVLDATVGFDPDDEQTAAGAGQIPESYLQALTPSALRGKRIGVLEELLLVDPEDMEVVAVLSGATAELVGLGAEVVRVQMPDIDELLGTRLDGFFVLAHDFRTDINAYLAQHPGAPVESLEDILASGRYHPVLDSPLRMSLATDMASEGDYQAELQHRQVIRQSILALMASQDLDVLAYPTIRRKPAVIGAIQEGANCQLSANSGLPAISVPAGFTSDGLPVGLELLARPWQEGLLLAMAYAYEQGAPHRRPPQLKRERSNESNGIRRR
jgi:Asp-tRNA(Asn)/Glu-tRNA(Gln) amidotransferase A subunit family amidase